MSDAAVAEPRAAALESSGPSDAMKSSASKTWRGWPADVRRSHRAAGMESPDARKTREGGRSDAWEFRRARRKFPASPSP